MKTFLSVLLISFAFVSVPASAGGFSDLLKDATKAVLYERTVERVVQREDIGRKPQSICSLCSRTKHYAMTESAKIGSRSSYGSAVYHRVYGKSIDRRTDCSRYNRHRYGR